MLSARVANEIEELRLDLAEARSGKLRLGLAVAIATAAVTASGWPATDVVHRSLFLVLGALPCAGIGLGLIVTEILHTREDRRGEEQADDREVQALRTRIAQDASGLPPASILAPLELVDAVVEVATVQRCRRPAAPSRPIVGGRRGRRLITRSGVLRLR